MTNCLGIECDQMIVGSYQPSMFEDKSGFTIQPSRKTVKLCKKLGYYPDPIDCRICRKADTIYKADPKKNQDSRRTKDWKESDSDSMDRDNSDTDKYNDRLV